MNKTRIKHLLIGEFSWQRLVRSVIFIYAFLCFYAFFLTDRQIFQPQKASYQDSATILKLTSRPGIQISAVYLPNPKASYTILYSHGNAEDLGEIQPILAKLQALGFAVFAYDYQGYGTSQGTASELGAYQDIEAAERYLGEKLGVSPQQLIIYGRSVGSGPSVDLAMRRPVAGLIVESGFLSAFRAVTYIPLAPFDKFANIDKISKVRCPVLVIHGQADEVVPFWQGKQLYAAAHPPKFHLWVEAAGHNDAIEVAGDRYDRTLRKFAQWLKSRTGDPAS